jgi:alkylation response protein AidB-like acyl-CoA dehydrogenase
MNLALSDDQRMIRDAAASFLADASSATAVRAALERPEGFDPQLWAGIGELGWCGVAVPEAFGGMGLGAPELVLVLEQMGRHLACAPYFPTVALAANLLVQVGTAAARKKYLPPLARGELRAAACLDVGGVTAKKGKGGAWRLDGQVAGLAGAAQAQLLLFATKQGVFATAPDVRGLKLAPRPAWDATRPQADVTLSGAPAERVDDPKHKHGLARAVTLARLFLAAEQLGGAQQCLDLVVRYTSERRQFGRAIASFQAVKHRCAQMMVKVESLRSLVYGAAASGDPHDCDAAKALASDTFFDCASEAIQLHGGVGFTWEFEPQLHFKRAQATSHALGTASALRERIAAAVL